MAIQWDVLIRVVVNRIFDLLDPLLDLFHPYYDETVHLAVLISDVIGIAIVCNLQPAHFWTGIVMFAGPAITASMCIALEIKVRQERRWLHIMQLHRRHRMTKAQLATEKPEQWDYDKIQNAPSSALRLSISWYRLIFLANGFTFLNILASIGLGREDHWRPSARYGRAK